MYYQWVMCSAIWMTGLFIQLLIFAFPMMVGKEDTTYGTDDLNPITTGRPDAYSVKFIPMAALGGALWATGNTMSVPVINLIGLSMGLLIWGAANMLTGWASGAFGLVANPFGHGDLDDPGTNAPMMITGVVLAVVSLGMYTQIKAGDPVRPAVNSSEGEIHVMDEVLLDHQPTKAKSGASRIAGITMAVLAGILFGNTFSPPNWVKNYNHGPSGDLDYVFSHFTGIFATSTIWFIVYCIIMRGSPMINHRLTLPAMLSGAMWAVAQTMWFLANTALSVSVSFPLITSGPGIVSAMWGVFVFGEITGTRNYIVLCLAIVTAVVGCVLIGASKGGGC